MSDASNKTAGQSPLMDTSGYKPIPFSNIHEFPKSQDSNVSKNRHLMVIYILPRPGPGQATSVRDRNTFRSNAGPVTSIALYMPSTIAYSQNNLYEDVSLTELGSKVLSSFGKAGGIAAATGTVAQLLGRPINPFVEVLFKQTALRTFTFDFLFAPTSQQDADEVKKIIKVLREAAAPEINGSGNGLASFFQSVTYIPPSKVNIEFYQNFSTGSNRSMQKNENIPAIGTCSIESIDVDYAPSGVYSTFTNGYPVSTRMQIKLKEDNTLTGNFVRQGF